MRIVNVMAFQGDVAFIKVASLPKDIAPEATDIVAHSETGHHHVVEGMAFKLFRKDSMICYLSLTEPADIVHRRSFDTHETLRLTPGIWEVRRQREWAPEGWRQVAD